MVVPQAQPLPAYAIKVYPDLMCAELYLNGTLANHIALVSPIESVQRSASLHSAAGQGLASLERGQTRV